MSGPPAVELERPRRIHLVGAGGAGMSGIAEILAAMGHRVSGSDERPSSALERLGALGLRTAVGHHPDNLGDAELVACSSAIPAGNVEAAAARAGGLPVLSRAELLGAICRQRRTVAVAGGSGKTTTTAMLALILAEAGLAPSFLVGGELVGLGCGARWDRGEHFVVEADESDGSFLALGAYAAIVTTVEADHLDHWGSFEALQAGFARFLAAAPGPKVVGADDPGAAALAAAVPGAQTYGQ
ncbi:MAG: Mur ligase domain-containing protein, partial [Acidimicrobiales bacterium]